MIDPTHTTNLRNLYAMKLRGEFYKLSTEIERWFADSKNWLEDITFNQLDTNASSKWDFVNPLVVIGKFTTWLKKRITDRRISNRVDTFVDDGFESGINRAESLLPTATISPVASLAFRTGSFKERLDILKSQSKAAITTLGDKTLNRAVQLLTEGLSRGESPRTIGRTINKILRRVSKTDATRIARTEVIRAHAEGTLERMKSMGINKVGVEVEWSVTKLSDGSIEKRVCNLCRAMNGLILPIEKAHGLIPRHPNCRCAWIPAFESVSKTKIRNAVKRSVESSRSKRKQSSSPAVAANHPPSSSNWPGKAMEDFIKS